MATRSRPLSPHLQVYRPQLTSVLSITHRATGVALAIGRETFEHFMTCVDGKLGRLLTGAFVFCLIYHLLNGIRHLAWDTGWGLDLKRAYATGWSLVVLAPLLTAVALWCLWT